MARPQTIQDDVLLDRLSRVFRDVGYAGASLSQLAEAAGLRKASLYHRFPGGKQQMAEEVLAAALGWYKEHVIDPLTGPGTPAERVQAAVRKLDAFYAGGSRACLLNMLSAPRADAGPISVGIKSAFGALSQAFAAVARDGGLDARRADIRAERAVMMLHGSLVMSRGIGTPAPFRAFLDSLAGDLLDPASHSTSLPPQENQS